MLSSKQAIQSIFKRHGDDAVYITNTGYNSRAVHSLYSTKLNILYMQGSMGLSPAIGLGIAMNTKKDVVVFVGDASLLMHLGVTHTIRDAKVDNLFIYVINNGCHESVGEYKCSKLLPSYPAITEIIETSCDGKESRVAIDCKGNITNLKDILNA